jgi:hypothetical protein
MIEDLSKPITDEEVEWRTQTYGTTEKGNYMQIVPHITPRVVQNRFDEAVGPFNWNMRLREVDKGFICRISVWDYEKQQWIFKEDGASLKEDKNVWSDPIKTVVSEAIKRTAVQWGIGRELYGFNNIWGKNVKTEQKAWNIPKDKKTVITYDKEKKINYWCYAPSLEGEKKAEPKIETGIDLNALPAEVQNLVADIEKALADPRLNPEMKEEITAFSRQYMKKPENMTINNMKMLLNKIRVHIVTEGEENEG